jgi:hypothetical protein
MVDHGDVNLKAEKKSLEAKRGIALCQPEELVCAKVQPVCVVLDLSTYELGGGFLLCVNLIMIDDVVS